MSIQHGLPGLLMLRSGKRIKQKDLAKKVGVSQNHLSGVETGSREASLILAKKLADALDCSVDDLLSDPMATETEVSQ